MKKAFIAFAAILMVSAAAAQAENIGTGMVDASSPFYGLEVAMDNAAISFGMANASKIALERASEARAAAAQNNSRAVQKAVGQFNRMTETRNITGLSKAQSMLQQAMQNAPAEAQQGLQTALDNVGKAMERRAGPPSGTPGGSAPEMNGSMPGRTSGSGMNGSTGGMNQSAPTNTTSPDSPVSSGPQNGTQ